MMYPHRTRFLATFTLACALLLGFSGTAAAQDTVGISPLIIEKVLTPGTVYKDTIRVSNTGKTPVQLKKSVADFYYTKEGQMQFVEEAEQPISTASIKAWLAIETEGITLAAGDSRELPVTITVPQDAQPGGHYGVLFMQTVSTAESVVKVEGRVGTLVLIEVPGDVNKTGTLSDVLVGNQIQGETSTIFESHTYFEKPPIDFAFSVLNTGNVHYTPGGTITVTNLFGRKVASMDAQPSERTARYRAFPGVQRQFVRSWDDPGFLAGRYTATFAITDGDGKDLPPQSISFTVFPWKFLLSALLIALIALSLLVTLIKRYNAYILGKAKHHR